MEQINLNTIEEVTAHVKSRLDLYKAKGIRDDPLWERWVENFEDWDVKLFSKIEPELRREFRDYLVSRGIYMEPNPKGKHIDQQLAKEVKREDFHEWTPEQIVFYQKKNPCGVSSRCDPEDPSYKKHERTLLAAAEYERRKEGLEEDTECKKEAVLEEKGKKAEFKFNDITDYDVKSMLCDNVDQLSRGEPRQRSYPRDNDQLPWEERPLH
ncbi:hypothetical protein K3495_g10160 [Podosphaera aphanis]|nr:hypothetical protein K3495_g10160 [Podosphaera aphanis]